MDFISQYATTTNPRILRDIRQRRTAYLAFEQRCTPLVEAAAGPGARPLIGIEGGATYVLHGLLFPTAPHGWRPTPMPGAWTPPPGAVGQEVSAARPPVHATPYLIPGPARAAAQWEPWLTPMPFCVHDAGWVDLGAIPSGSREALGDAWEPAGGELVARMVVEAGGITGIIA